jgi:hypothetical protein
MAKAHQSAFIANTAVREVTTDAAKFAALAAGQAVAVAHVPAHELGAAAYAIRAVQAAASESEREQAGRQECLWQREQLPDESEISCLTINGCAMIYVGLCSIVSRCRFR